MKYNQGFQKIVHIEHIGWHNLRKIKIEFCRISLFWYFSIECCWLVKKITVYNEYFMKFLIIRRHTAVKVIGIDSRFKMFDNNRAPRLHHLATNENFFFSKMTGWNLHITSKFSLNIISITHSFETISFLLFGFTEFSEKDHNFIKNVSSDTDLIKLFRNWNWTQLL